MKNKLWTSIRYLSHVCPTMFLLLMAVHQTGCNTSPDVKVITKIQDDTQVVISPFCTGEVLESGDVTIIGCWDYDLKGLRALSEVYEGTEILRQGDVVVLYLDRDMDALIEDGIYHGYIDNR